MQANEKHALIKPALMSVFSVDIDFVDVKKALCVVALSHLCKQLKGLIPSLVSVEIEAETEFGQDRSLSAHIYVSKVILNYGDEAVCLYSSSHLGTTLEASQQRDEANTYQLNALLDDFEPCHDEVFMDLEERRNTRFDHLHKLCRSLMEFSHVCDGGNVFVVDDLIE